jgi:hypothetical protein
VRNIAGDGRSGGPDVPEISRAFRVLERNEAAIKKSGFAETQIVSILKEADVADG